MIQAARRALRRVLPRAWVLVWLWLCALVMASPAYAATFVLVNGSWVGAWYWDPVVAALETAGHRALPVELRGQGARIAEGGPDVDLAGQADDILAVIATADEPVILVAHSAGGRPATRAWDLARDRIAHVVYAEAIAPYLPPPGVIPADSRSLSFLVMTMPDIADTGMLPPSPTLRDVAGHPLAAMSLKALFAGVTLENGPLPDTPGTYIVARDTDAPMWRQLGEYLRDERGWDLVDIDGTHDLAGSAPEAFSAALLAIAAQVDARIDTR